MTTVADPRPLDVYVINGKRKPVATGEQVDAARPLPTTVTHAGATYHFSNADFVEKTATFTNVPLAWH